MVKARRARSRKTGAAALPSEAEILEFVQNSTGKVGKREISRAFGIKGPLRVPLKQLLKNMTERGLLEKSKARKLHDPSRLPPVLVAEVTGQDDDGELYAQPANWDEDRTAEPPKILLKIRKARGHTEDRQPPGAGDRILVRVTRMDDPVYAYEGTIIRRLDAGVRRIIGIFQKHGKAMRIVPVERRARAELEVLPGDDAKARHGELVAVELKPGRGMGLKKARVRERLGKLDDQRNISLIAIHEHGIRDTFPDEVIRETDALKPITPDNRKDIRETPLITIDPADARDHDDAVFAEPDDHKDNKGGHRVIVAIADVAWYVRPSGHLDREARERGNSTYFPDRVVPMLPERISNDLCSLRENEDRPALAVTMVFDKDGKKLRHTFERVLMRSHAKLSYQQAQAAIDGNPDEAAAPLLEPVLKPLWKAYDALQKARRKRQPLELDLPERKALLNDNGSIDRIIVPDRLDAHKLIEEFMIQANVAAAETLEKRRSPLVYRLHEVPSVEKLQGLREFLATIGIKLPKAQVFKPQDFNKILEQMKGKDTEAMVNEMVLRTQAQAIYSATDAGHFGLNLRRYSHFTSPIRRYADLIIHRALISALGFGEDGLSDQDIEDLEHTAEQISNAERRSMAAERQTMDRLLASWLSEHVGGTFRGRISGVTRAGLFVRLNETGADGFVPASTIAGDYFVHDETAQALIGEQTGETFRMGDTADVRLMEVTPLAGGLRFEILNEGRPGKPALLRKRTARPKRPPKRGRGRR
ncbi:MAG: ribonuclease R [Pseudomonadota bacterium]